jgi:hypothetical protein
MQFLELQQEAIGPADSLNFRRHLAVTRPAGATLITVVAMAILYYQKFSIVCMFLPA